MRFNFRVFLCAFFNLYGLHSSLFLRVCCFSSVYCLADGGECAGLKYPRDRPNECGAFVALNLPGNCVVMYFPPVCLLLSLFS